jgi:DNA-directed RNA polymerase subunit RPC12/RpoP
MSRFGKGALGSGTEVNAQVVNGKCPYCSSDSIFISLHQTIYRCINCGSDIEQKVNGKISYIPYGKNIVMDLQSPPGNGKT